MKTCKTCHILPEYTKFEGGVHLLSCRRCGKNKQSDQSHKAVIRLWNEANEILSQSEELYLMRKENAEMKDKLAKIEKMVDEVACGLVGECSFFLSEEIKEVLK